ncbi:MAG: cytochrome P450 [Bradymonadia bacterium]|jgi:cytochrome P450
MNDKTPPGPSGLAPLTSAIGMFKDAVGFARSMVETYGSISRTRIGADVTWFIAEPSAIEELLLSKHKVMHKDSITAKLKNALGEGLVTSEGELWKKQRRLAAPTLGRRQIASYADTMVECARDYAEGLCKGDSIDVNEDMSAVTMRIVVCTLFGADVADEVKTVQAALHTVLSQFDAEIHTWRFFLPDAIPTPGRIESKRAVKTLDTIVNRYIELRRADEEPGDDLISRLLAATDEDGTRMPAKQLRDEAITMFAAGHETTSIALTNTFYQLARHPEAAARLDAELEEVLQGRDPTIADLPKLVWTNACLQESLRISPPAWIIGREPQEDVEIGGYQVKKGDQLVVPIAAMCRSERWFLRPNQYEPERWLDGLEERLPRFAFLPFGGGPRVCIGNHFAMMELVLVFVTIRMRHKFDVDPNFVLEHEPAVTLRPANGLPAQVA